MKKLIACLLALSLLTVLPAGAEETLVIHAELAPKTQEETLSMLSAAAEAYFSDAALVEELRGEISVEEITDPFETGEGEVYRLCTLTHQGQTMRFLMGQNGEPGENGRYPLYITLHGGGGGAPEGNDVQWFMMYEYYRPAVKNGIYVACRGITDTWDLHFRPESYPLYDRLIQAMIYLYQADPNRVYLLGFSAGGDGVYQIAPRMADRFAAANMSSGHPNGVSLRNLYSCPFSIQVGVRDYYSESALRCIRAAEFENTLTAYHDQLGSGYTHQVLIHVPEGHNYNDYEDTQTEVLTDPAAYADPAITEAMLVRFLEAFEATADGYGVSSLSYYGEGENEAFDGEIRRIVKEEFHLDTAFVNANAVAYVSQFTRDPAPKTVVWDLSTRAASRDVTSFYWLRADASVNQGVITASLIGDNALSVKTENVNGDFSILVNPLLLDVSRPIRIETAEGVYEVQVNPSPETLLASIRETGDPSLAWAAEIPLSMLH